MAVNHESTDSVERTSRLGGKKIKVCHLKYRRLRSRKLKFGRENFKV